ncbi:hypothetical protein VNI00_008649 [Paramarasmius palmivorus]|uniref:Protein kinase domain-containing protein n=1 Tax=Paramarasmius palmivorus TaxID=297713 RepID=A0AAW0CWR7_9AGAR
MAPDMSNTDSTWISAFQNTLTISQPSNVSQEDIDADAPVPRLNEPTFPGQISTFVLLVAGYEKALRDDTPLLFDSAGASFSDSRNRTPIASGASFSVERATWSNRGTNAYMVKWGETVALKYVRRKGKDSLNWKQILLEIRALFHEPIRYHPNIVRLLGLSWGAAHDTGTSFPMLVLELADFGTLAHLQVNQQLSFAEKKKLCYDVSKGLSIIHACGIVHGDLKHENVLIFANKVKDAKVGYVAKLGDFGGSVMDIETEGSLPMGTPPYDAPESRMKLDAEAMKRTDVYSLGLLVWRTMLDGQNPFHYIGGGLLSNTEIEQLKRSDEVLQLAKDGMRTILSGVEPTDYELLDHAFDNTLQLSSARRSLTQAIAALQAESMTQVAELIAEADKANAQEEVQDKERIPGQRGITQDGLGVYIAKSSPSTESYDFQKHGPGHRPIVFEPERLKTILDWSIQEEIFHDLEQAAVAVPEQSPSQMPNVLAMFFLFRCYCHELGTVFNAERACYWLKQAALSTDECQENYLAQAWCWRVHRALDVPLDVDTATLRDWIMLAVIRGHRRCIDEARIICETQLDPSERGEWMNALALHTTYLNTMAGGVGMPYFAPRKLRRNYDLRDLDALDRDIQAEFTLRGVTSIDDIFVNHRGDGLLHYAASMGCYPALKHLVDKYKPNIDLDYQTKYESPLLSACRSGHLACALFLLDIGAKPDGGRFAEETALYWLSSFAEKDIPIIAKRLVEAGAQLENEGHQRATRLRRLVSWADYEDFYLLPVSPLSRAVMMESIPAVHALLALGANPAEKIEDRSSVCPLVLAAVLMLPDILQILLHYFDSQSETPIPIFNELEMIQFALDLKPTIHDPLSLQSRLSRNVKPDAVKATLRILHERHDKVKLRADDAQKSPSAVDVITRLVRLGREDLVRPLLELGHSIEGHEGPMIEAVKMNNESMFRLLLQYGADVNLTTSTWAEHNLIQILADRPNTARPGLYIAEYLVERGLAVNPPAEAGVRSAFASAVLRQDFELADFLLQHGADVNYSYVYPKEMVMTTLLGDIARNPTGRNVESLKYLLNLDDSGCALEGTPKSRARPDILPDFIVCKENQWSVFHYLARYISRTDPEKHAQSRMGRLLLSVEYYRERINYAPSDSGTALILAAIAANLEVVSELVEHGADVNLGMSVVTPSIAVQAMFQSYPDVPKDFELVWSNDKVTQEIVWKRYTLIAQLLVTRTQE